MGNVSALFHQFSGKRITDALPGTHSNFISNSVLQKENIMQRPPSSQNALREAKFHFGNCVGNSLSQPSNCSGFRFHGYNSGTGRKSAPAPFGKGPLGGLAGASRCGLQSRLRSRWPLPSPLPGFPLPLPLPLAMGPILKDPFRAGAGSKARGDYGEDEVGKPEGSISVSQPDQVVRVGCPEDAYDVGNGKKFLNLDHNWLVAEQPVWNDLAVPLACCTSR